jgi:hypothetical protein
VQLHVAERAAERLLGLGQPVEAQPWLGARPCSADMLPVIGPAPRHRGLWFHWPWPPGLHPGSRVCPASGRTHVRPDTVCGPCALRSVALWLNAGRPRPGAATHRGCPHAHGESAHTPPSMP